MNTKYIDKEKAFAQMASEMNTLCNKINNSYTHIAEFDYIREQDWVVVYVQRLGKHVCSMIFNFDIIFDKDIVETIDLSQDLLSDMNESLKELQHIEQWINNKL
jgi:hypothetical protein